MAIGYFYLSIRSLELPSFNNSIQVSICMRSKITGSSQVVLMVKNLPSKQEMQVWSLGWEYPQRSKWQPTPVFLSGKSHGQRSLEGYNPRGCEKARHDLVTKQQNDQSVLDSGKQGTGCTLDRVHLQRSDTKQSSTNNLLLQ